MKRLPPITLLLCLTAAGTVLAQAPQSPPQQPGSTFQSAVQDVADTLRRSLDELAQLREQITAERLGLSQRLSQLEEELLAARQEQQQQARAADVRAAELIQLAGEARRLRDEAGFVTDLLGEYRRNFPTRLHVVEVQRYASVVDAAALAADHPNLPATQANTAQVALLQAALQRLEDALGGTRFGGSAVDAGGAVRQGTFALLGPAALFRSDDGAAVGVAEQRLNAPLPVVVPLPDPDAAVAAAAVVRDGSGAFPFDPTLGAAVKIGATRETLWEHMQKGGPVMVPIFALAAAALLVALWKWLGLMLLRRPSRREVAALLAAVEGGDRSGATAVAERMRGPVGTMLAQAVAHLGEPRELIEEVMFETVLKTRHRLQRMLPFLAIAAASAPLLGLLGTVTGIIHTFKLITVYGSGDVKYLSAGISEALITTEFGLIVAIPSLLLHAWLARKARAVVGDMEATALALLNQLPRQAVAAGVPAAVGTRASAAAADPIRLRQEVRAILGEMLGPLTDPDPGAATAGGARA